MQKDQILQIAISKKISQNMIGKNSKSAFSIVHQCILSIDNSKMSDEEKKEELLKRLQNFWQGNSKYIANCKREQICSIVKLAFGIGSAQDNSFSTSICSFTFSEFFLYYCYIERIAISDHIFSQFLWDDHDKRHSKFSHKRAEEQQIKDGKERKTIAGILKEYWIALSYSQYFS